MGEHTLSTVAFCLVQLLLASEPVFPRRFYETLIEIQGELLFAFLTFRPALACWLCFGCVCCPRVAAVCIALVWPACVIA